MFLFRCVSSDITLLTHQAVFGACRILHCAKPSSARQNFFGEFSAVTKSSVELQELVAVFSITS